MTARCTGGTSGPKVGVAAVVDYSSGLLALRFAALEIPWLIPAIPLLGLVPLVLSSFCSSDPPAVPSFTSAETNALLQLKFGADFDSGLAKMRDLALNAIWDDACQCTSGTYVPFTPPSAPAGTPIFVPPPAPSIAPCATYQHSGTIVAGAAAFLGPSIDIGGLNASLAVLTVTATFPGPVGTLSLSTVLTDLSGQTAQAPVAQVPLAQVGVQQQSTTILKPGYLTAQMKVTFAGTTATTATYDAKIDLYCNGALPGGSQQPCCPPDVATQAYLDIILKQVNLIQRQAAPFGYIPSTITAGVSGAGFLAISGLIGIKLEITTDSTALGVEGTSPAELFQRGWVTFATDDGALHSARVEHAKQLVLPCDAGVFTKLYYDLHPGIVCTITQLVREP